MSPACLGRTDKRQMFFAFFFLVDRVVLSSYFPHSHLIIKIVFLKLDSRRIYWLESALTSDTKMNF